MRSCRLRGLVQGVAVLAVAAPALGITLLVSREAAMEPGAFTLDRVFHLALGVAMLQLFADFFVAIRRSGGTRITLALGAGGLVVCLIGAIVCVKCSVPPHSPCSSWAVLRGRWFSCALARADVSNKRIVGAA